MPPNRQTRTPAPVSLSIVASTPGSADRLSRSMAAPKDRSKARFVTCAHASLPGNILRKMSRLASPRARCTWTIQRAYAAVPVTIP